MKTTLNSAYFAEGEPQGYI